MCYLVVVCITESGVFKSLNIIIEQFFPYVNFHSDILEFCCYVCNVYDCYIFLMDWAFLSIYNIFVSWIFFYMKSMLSDECSYTALFWLQFARYIFFLPFIQSVCIFSSEASHF